MGGAPSRVRYLLQENSPFATIARENGDIRLCLCLSRLRRLFRCVLRALMVQPIQDGIYCK